MAAAGKMDKRRRSIAMGKMEKDRGGKERGRAMRLAKTERAVTVIESTVRT